MPDLLTALRERPLPDLAPARAAKQAYSRIPIRPAAYGEALVQAAQFQLAGRNHYAHPFNPPYWTVIPGAIDALWLRPTVGERLARAERRLQAWGLRLFLLDAWRPRAVQAYFHGAWFPAQVRARHPDWSAAQVLAEVERYWSAPSSEGAPAPHATGAAVDLTLTTIDGAALFFGSVFDDVTALAHPDHFEALAGEASFSACEARANRRLLYWVLQEEGFAGHPDEWWHFSYGDQMWAALTGAEEALFGEAAPPQEGG
jgi:D-alanyl-D-alanine dipeptidase